MAVERKEIRIIDFRLGINCKNERNSHNLNFKEPNIEKIKYTCQVRIRKFEIEVILIVQGSKLPATILRSRVRSCERKLRRR